MPFPFLIKVCVLGRTAKRVGQEQRRIDPEGGEGM